MKHILFLVVGMLLISCTFALEFDNIKREQKINEGEKISIGEKQIEYNKLWEKYPVLEIKNNFGLGETLFKGAITEHTEFCDTNCYSVFIVELPKESILLQDVYFYQLRYNSWTGGYSEHEIPLSYKVYYKNGANWIRFNKNDVFSPGTYEIKIEGVKNPHQKVDWRIKTQGDILDEWAVWDSFTVGLTAENITFTTNENITRNLSVPSTTFLTNATIKLTGFNKTTAPTGYPTNASLIINGSYVWNGTGTGLGGQIHYYKLDETSQPAEDSAGSLYLNDSGGVSFGTTGKLNKAVFFNGTNYLNGTNLGTQFGNISSFSINFWLWANSTTDDYIFRIGDSINPSRSLILITGGNIGYRKADGSPVVDSSVAMPTNGWNMITLLYNGSAANLFLNGSSILNATDTSHIAVNPNLILGTLDQVNGLVGGLDEFGVFNKTLTYSEIQTEFNSGSGSSYANAEFRNSETVTTLKNYLNAVIAGCTSVGGNCTIPFIFHSDTAGLLEYSALLFSNDGIIENSQSYNATVYETEEAQFSINFSYDNSLWTSTSANLIYNGTSYTGATTNTGNTRVYSKTLTIPNTNNSVTNDFYWSIALTNATGTYYRNSTAYTQTVNVILFTQCNATYKTQYVNYTIYDENLPSTKVLAEMDVTFTYWLGDGTAKKSTSLDSQNYVNSYSFCANVNKTFYADIFITLKNNSYSTRTLTFNDEVFTNLTTFKNIYMVNSTEGTDVIIQVRDAGLVPIQGYYVSIERYYPGSNNYSEVVSAVTDEYGQFVATLIEDIVKYRFTFKDSSGNIVKTTTDMTIACRSSTCVLPFVIEDTTDDFSRFSNITNYDWTFIFSNSTNTFTFSWNDVSGTSATNWLTVERILLNGTSIVSGCNTTSSLTSGSLTCNVGSQDASYTAVVYRKVGSGDWVRVSELYAKVGTTYNTFGIEGLIWSFLLLMTSIALGYAYPPVGMVLYGVVALFLSLTNIIYINPGILIAQFFIVVVFCWAFGGSRS